MSRADYEKLGLPRYEAAFRTTHWGKHPEYGTPITTYVWRDCFGGMMLIGKSGHTSSFYAKWCGCGGAYPKYWCTSEIGHRGTKGGIDDVRSLKMIVAGCCPIELTDEILEAGAMVD